MDLSRKPTNPQRLPPPALFQGPPSHNASNISLSVPPASSALATPSGSQPPPLHRNRTPRGEEGENVEKSSLLSPFVSRRQSKNDPDGSDAIWQEMQSALSEVELSAVTSENVFGEKHSEALEDLRSKQLKLAQAWARSEADDEVVDPSHTGPDAASAKANSTRRGETNIKDDAATETSAGRGSVSHHTLDEETEKDIRLARKRREANDRYFDRVNQGVLDVVAKLEEVAQAMRTVERESKDIWSDSESVTTTAPSSTH
ncbi:unnamed protein product [Penicillium salamii]|uniref:Uncharacterized protein n=1 Tax=Penicillium salamii TaxID=1612424 RepID=A0A9W4NW97_9EURO|nr:unnamed protein product [Penicillium salamii]CAG8045760.1 unnamed protein product [Penicillium salamii]CAG8109061.1 unnamed protein product [Penicillium salamii]CAG8142209.1 unnamed protein product [Penicillium salamii]CAG8175402.1 unnamed protein product [Penicillium salamii]